MKKLFIFLFSIAMFVGCSNSNEPSTTTDVFPYKNGQRIKQVLYVKTSVLKQGEIETENNMFENVRVEISDNILKFYIYDTYSLFYTMTINNDYSLNINLEEGHKFLIPNITDTYELSYNSDYPITADWSYYYQYKWDNKLGFIEIVERTFIDKNKSLYFENHYYFYY